MEIENVRIVRSMERDSIASACNTDFESHNFNSDTAKTTRDDSQVKSVRGSKILGR